MAILLTNLWENVAVQHLNSWGLCSADLMRNSVSKTRENTPKTHCKERKTALPSRELKNINLYKK